MCGAYGFSIKNAKDVYDRFEIVNELPDLQPQYKLLPGQMNPVITSHSPNQISRVFWGLIPYWANDEKVKFSTINARAETVATAATYKEPFRTKRCLVPANYFFEPDKVHYEKPPRPWYLYQFKDQRIFAFAGIYDIWKDNNTGREIYSYSIITTEPNKVVGEIHPRMPVILHKDDEETWLNPDITEPEHLLPLLKPYEPADEMEGWRLADAARNPRNTGADIIKPIH
jgi:putative SOS response-associated peptidase YedK